MTPGCVLQAADFTIYTTLLRIEYNFNILLLNSTVNNIVNLTYHKVPWEVLHHSNEIETQEIDKRLIKQKEREVLPATISSHDVHQYAISYTLLGAASLLTITWIVRKYRLPNCTRHRNNRPERTRHDDIELQGSGPERAGERRAPAPPAPSTVRGELRRSGPTATKCEDNFAFNFDD